MSTEHLVLIGAGGHARVVFDALQAAGSWPSVEIRDDRATSDQRFEGLPVLAPAIPSAFARPCLAHVAVGRNTTRQMLAEKVMSLQVRLAIVMHPRATVSKRSQIGPGVFIAANAAVGPGAKLGDGVIVNHNAVVDHDCDVGAWTHIAPGAILGGAVIVGVGVLVGAGAVVLPGIRIGSGASIGAGAVVTRPVAANAVVMGVPARARTINGAKA